MNGNDNWSKSREVDTSGMTMTGEQARFESRQCEGQGYCSCSIVECDVGLHPDPLPSRAAADQASGEPYCGEPLIEWVCVKPDGPPWCSRLRTDGSGTRSRATPPAAEGARCWERYGNSIDGYRFCGSALPCSKHPYIGAAEGAREEAYRRLGVLIDAAVWHALDEEIDRIADAKENR